MPNYFEKRAFFAATEIPESFGDGLLCHGGLSRLGAFPKSDFILVKPPSENGEICIEEFSISNEQNNPCLSHHCAALLSQRYFVLIGGWNGKKRTSSVHVLDIQTKTWLEGFHLDESSDPPPVGLSGHTVTPVGTDQLVVIGREGGVKEQRRFGDIFKLKVNINKRTYAYQEMRDKSDSRTGHVAVGTRLGILLIGGRADDVFQLVKLKEFSSEDSKLSIKLDDFDLIKLEKAGLPGLRYHSVSAFKNDLILLHGGENFKSRDNQNSETFLLKLTKTGEVETYLVKNGSPMKRYGHKLLTCRDQIYAIGGFSSDPKMNFLHRLMKLSK